jgi:transcriptional regulator of acetoin/glycerol metabolism
LGSAEVADDITLTEQQVLMETLRRQRWNISAVAKQLNVSRPTIYRRMKKHHIILPKDLFEYPQN